MVIEFIRRQAASDATQPTKQRFLVSPWGFDNIGEVFKKVAQGFEHEKIGWGRIKSLEANGGCDVLFVNCAFRFAFGYGRRAAPALAEEVGVSIPTISRIVAALREQGYDIQAELTQKGWRYVLEKSHQRATKSEARP